ncbi:hypothetical protein RRV45_04650 [Bacillus sp. DTU_2020_1000418_1_SI_GHA_SEK_038]|uniref:hypothetical protein n=1 Tax=Bacillus sp. DTU_2020_1000418_1_SI_GHA_SEK_038 TaxID=3077585 RepID=UPI0028E6AECE|nr:hypothetical protein [Bacillus sp. DTU_2020_1000418_1_SI_GHA_SEK_038]WNS76302.1 hypothetical protein RRV45_04650 [Bacillus sp. DTU_2020_1000418_1_SI_GHA_SEK_038]
MLNNPFDDQWKQLKHLYPTQKEKDALRARLWQSLKNQSVNRSPKRNFQWKALLASSLFVLICSGFIWKVISNGTGPHAGEQRNAEEQPITMDIRFSWEAKDVQIEKSSKGWDVYSKDSANKVGTIEVVTEEELKEITSSLAMFVKEELGNFPYPTTMNIEHVKRMDTAIRYHFFISMENEKFAHFSFDYPKLEHAEIFQAMATLKIAGISPVQSEEPIYVKHGYGAMIFPVGLEPISLSHAEEIYHWKEASLPAYHQYLDKILEGHWKREASKGTTATFVSGDGREIVSITLEDKYLIYEFTYLHDDQQ